MKIPIITIYPVYAFIDASSMLYPKCFFPIEFIKVSVLIKISCCYLFNLISFCWSSDGINKLVIFISPCHVIFYKKLLKALERFWATFFVSVFIYLWVIFSGSFINFKILFWKLLLFGSFTPIAQSMFQKFFFFCCVN